VRGPLLPLILALATLPALPLPARAEPPRAPDPGTAAERAALAEALFEKGKALMAERRYDQACSTLAESQRLDPGGGTLLTLALCHEREGKTATAWTELKDALARAEQDGEADRVTVAREHARTLEAKLSRLAIGVDATVADTPDLSVSRDGIPLGRPAWGLAVPVDPGEHVVEVSAKGKRPWSVRVRVGADGDSARVDFVVPLADEPRAPRPVASGPSPRIVAAIVLGGAAAISLGVGAGYGIRAIVEQRDANAACPRTTCGDAAALSANGSARTAAVVADVAIPLGVAAGVASIVLFATAPKARDGDAAAGAWTITAAPALGFAVSARRSF
jgi:hypothetical protein